MSDWFGGSVAFASIPLPITPIFVLPYKRFAANQLLGEFWGQTLFSVFKNLASSAFGLRYPHSVCNFIRIAEAAVNQSANVAKPIKHIDELL